MAHKHKRKRDDDRSTYDLPPTSRAKPLPARKSDEPSKRRKKDNGTKLNSYKDDTPRAFARIMAFQSGKRLPSGLDDGSSTTKKSKKQPPVQAESTAETIPTQPQPETIAPLKIQPGERLSDFSLRVNQSLPLASVPRHTTKDKSGLKLQNNLTKHNKRLERMQKEWRSTETKLREKEDDEKDDQEDKREEEDLLWADVKATKRKKGKVKSVVDDPWKELERKRRETRQKNLQDVVLAPPVLGKVKNIFKVGG